MLGGGGAQEPMFHREYSEATQQYIDEEIAHIVENRYGGVKNALTQNRNLLDLVAAQHLEKESLGEKEFKELIGQSGQPAEAV
jgi:cell division protease FtsH